MKLEEDLETPGTKAYEKNLKKVNITMEKIDRQVEDITKKNEKFITL